MKRVALAALCAACGGSNKSDVDAPDFTGPLVDAYEFHDAPGPNDSPLIAGCPILPGNHVFNMPIDGLPVDPNSAAFITTIGSTTKLHLDLGQTVDPQANDFYGIPYNVVHGNSFTWPSVVFASADPDLDWDPKPESDCGNSSRAVVSPCTAATAYLPIPSTVVVEGGTNSAANQLPYADHHILLLDVDTCRLWETYHSYKPSSGTWNIFGSAQFDMRSNALRPIEWSSADAAGFPILPLLLRADEASTGTIKHALRFTIASNHIRPTYVWPARHITNNGMNIASQPPMGQLFRLKASFVIPANYSTQSKAILQAMKTYGMYIADGGSNWYVSGAPSADWDDSVFSQVQSVPGSAFEAVDITAITSRTGFDPNSGRVP